MNEVLLIRLTGDPASPFALAPTPNGGRTALGACGNSKHTSKTPPP